MNVSVDPTVHFYLNICIQVLSCLAMNLKCVLVYLHSVDY